MIFRAPALILLIGSWCVLANGNANCCEEYCYDSDPNRIQFLHFGRLTSYETFRKAFNHQLYVAPNCKPEKVWLLVRHGARQPRPQTLDGLADLPNLRDAIIDNYEKGDSLPFAGAMCKGDLELLRHWRWDTNMTLGTTKYLTAQGWNDLKSLAMRYRQTFPSIFGKVYDSQEYLFKHTDTQRTLASFKSFAEGLFGGYAARSAKAEVDELLLRPRWLCLQWIDNECAFVEMTKFENSDAFRQLINDVSTRLGFKLPLTLKQVIDVLDMCRYEVSWSTANPSPWCAAITPNQVNVLEYYEDLQIYPETGYGSEINPRIACNLVKDMIGHLRSDDVPNAIVYFSHSTPFQLFLTSLGVGKPRDSLRADNYEEMKDRPDTISKLCPLSSNLAAIKYHCPSEVEPKKVMFVLNEKPIDFDWCKDGLCDWLDVEEKYKFFDKADCRIVLNSASAHSTNSSIKQLLLQAAFCSFINLYTIFRLYFI